MVWRLPPCEFWVPDLGIKIVNPKHVWNQRLVRHLLREMLEVDGQSHAVSNLNGTITTPSLMWILFFVNAMQHSKRTVFSILISSTLSTIGMNNWMDFFFVPSFFNQNLVHQKWLCLSHFDVQASPQRPAASFKARRPAKRRTPLWWVSTWTRARTQRSWIFLIMFH